MGGREGLIFASTAAVSAIFFLPCSQIFRTTTSRAVQVSMRRDILCVMLGLSLSGGLVEGGGVARQVLAASGGRDVRHHVGTVPPWDMCGEVCCRKCAAAVVVGTMWGRTSSSLSSFSTENFF